MGAGAVPAIHNNRTEVHVGVAFNVVRLEATSFLAKLHIEVEIPALRASNGTNDHLIIPCGRVAKPDAA